MPTISNPIFYFTRLDNLGFDYIGSCLRGNALVITIKNIPSTSGVPWSWYWENRRAAAANTYVSDWSTATLIQNQTGVLSSVSTDTLQITLPIPVGDTTNFPLGMNFSFAFGIYKGSDSPNYGIQTRFDISGVSNNPTSGSLLPLGVYNWSGNTSTGQGSSRVIQAGDLSLINNGAGFDLTNLTAGGAYNPNYINLAKVFINGQEVVAEQYSFFNNTKFKFLSGTTVETGDIVDFYYPLTNFSQSGVTNGIGAVQDEGVTLLSRPTINFTGQGVSVTNDGVNNRYNVNISSGIGNGVTYIMTKTDLPAAVGGVITLDTGAYMLTDHVDLEGDRIEFTGDAVIFGTSSETCSLTSTGLTGNALITSQYDLPMRNLEIRNVDQGFDCVAINNTKAIDWNAVNFTDVAYIGRFSGYSNFIQTLSAFFNSGKIRFEGSIGTVGFDSTLFSLPVGTAIEFADDFVSTRRIRLVFCPFVVTSGNNGIDLPTTATVPTESFILSDCNFSGSGVYLVDVNHTSNTSLFKGNKGIINTSVNGQMYMQSNVTATTITNTTDFVKVAGTTTASADNQKYTHSNNRLTNAATISRKFLIQASLSFSSGNNHVCEFGFYDSELAAIRTPSRTLATANSAGRAENVSLFCVVEHNTGNYIEIHARNTTSATNITVTDMNVLITEIN